jgi:hypothetical protein
MRLKEKLAIFLHICRTGAGSDNTELVFGRTPDTVSRSALSIMNETLLIDVSRAFYLILNALVRLHHKDIRQPLSDDPIPSKILYKSKFYLYFKDCIGAIEGIYIYAYIPVSE